MKANKLFIYVALSLATLSLSSCHDWLTDGTPGVSHPEDYLTSGKALVELVNATYTPNMWEYGGGAYFSEWYIGDIASDDALKGGQGVTDGLDAYEIDNFKVNPNNEILLEYYRGIWQGIGRCNYAMSVLPTSKVEDEILNATPTTKKMEASTTVKERLIGEVQFMRAMYYFRLVRVFGGMPLIDFVVDTKDKWAQTRATQQETYEFILKDLEAAEKVLWYKSQYPAEDMGRATKGAAQAMLLKTHLYLAGFLAQEGKTTEATEHYQKARDWGKKILNSQEYRLCPQYFDNFTLVGENGPESVWEIQYVENPEGDYGSSEGGYGFTLGTFTVILQRSRSDKLADGDKGWGWDKPTQNLYDEYETGDIRRDATILNPTDDQMEIAAQEIYLGDRYLSKKYAMYTDGDGGKTYKLAHATRGPINNKVIRYADVLLMYAEACCELGGADLTAAKNALNEVRTRAGLATFPGYTYKVNGVNQTTTDTQEDLRKAIRHERRVELAMEAHRWFDLCRWGVAKATLEAYIARESEAAKAEFGTFAPKNVLFPIPQKEVELSGIKQNDGY